ncbi:hypothetical protein LTR78_005665 [Recurvomyces mirabilis]|uniref:Uncharacterized protein n=1 Tax=Recurvomyces mirabilis TaxID=574656 RepID=A0AAE1C1G7_9PEZI|nr:hypothetical protein LTR78_005665 [Recurvomyces mirabilis]KAK5151212.1 hypothetical protein LTS14_009382 [Recurvomyces mirabilis]
MPHSTSTANATKGSTSSNSRMGTNTTRRQLNHSGGIPLTAANLAQAAAIPNTPGVGQPTLPTDTWLGRSDDPFATGTRPVRSALVLQNLAATDPLAAELNAM